MNETKGNTRGKHTAYNVYGLNLISRYTTKTDDAPTNGAGGLANATGFDANGSYYTNNPYGFGKSSAATQNYTA